MPKVSIIIPVYNQTEFLRECLDSCINQTLQDIEIICVDDKSTDDSLEIIKEYAQKDDRIKVVAFSKNKGQGAARNAGLKIATGNYLMFLDPDDWYEQDACEVVYRQIVKNNNDYVIFGFRKYLQAEKEYEYSPNFLAPFEGLIGKPDIKLWEVKKRFIIASLACTAIYKTDFVKRNKIRFDEDLRDGEDLRFFITSILKSNSVSVMDKVLYNYRKHKEIRYDCANKIMAIIARKRAYNLILKSEHKKEYLDSYLPYYIHCCIGYRKYVKNCDDSIKKRYHNMVHDIFRMLNREYDILQYKDLRINYEGFMMYATQNWNQRMGIYFEIPYVIKIKKSKYDKIVFCLINNIIKIYKNKKDELVFKIYDKKYILSKSAK